MEMNVLSIDDIRIMKIEPNMSTLETLTEVLSVATKKLERESFMREEEDRINYVNKLEKFVERIKLMRERILKQPAVEEEQSAVEEDHHQVRSFIKNRPRTSICFKRKQSLEEENMEFMKKGKVCFEFESEEDAVKLKRRKKNRVEIDQYPTPELPEEFKNVIIAEMGGCDVKLVIQKKLYDADVKPEQSRLSIPISQIKDDFLTDAEKAMVNSRKGKNKKHCNEIKVLLIDPSVNGQIIYLRKWDMKKSSSSYTSMYVLAKSWNEVVSSNKLKVNNVVQLWSFRVETELCFALVRVERGLEDCGSSSKNRGKSESSSTRKEGENGTSSNSSESKGEGSSNSQMSEEGASNSSPEKEIQDGGMQY